MLKCEEANAYGIEERNNVNLVQGISFASSGDYYAECSVLGRHALLTTEESFEKKNS